MGYWIALALHLGVPQADGYAKLTSLKVPEWLASAEPRPRADDQGRTKREKAPPAATIPYEKLGGLKTY